jgi:glutamate synthase domain-containing protein 1
MHVCGIVGVFYKQGAIGPVGQVMTDMCDQLFRRGPDSAGVALYGPRMDRGFVVRVDLDRPDLDVAEGAVLAAADEVTSVKGAARTARSLRLIVADDAEGKLADLIEERVPAARVFSIGRSMEIVKDLGMACDINQRYDLGAFRGTHGIGHTRMATESRVTTEHSHPFSTGLDLCLVHNGSLSNHNRLRQELRREGVSFQTDNDTEVAAGYLTWRLREGADLREALEGCLRDLDGFYTFAVGTADGFAVLRDPIACKPAVLAETDDWVAMASEYRAIAVLPGAEDANVWEPAPATLYVWERALV